MREGGIEGGGGYYIHGLRFIVRAGLGASHDPEQQRRATK